ncbi:hypothetical protein AMJ51_02415 [Microgenomates bacterium DG_75]|nr:MAG: hypothetical protein AMJ51_02415 [Microgenomates bacterium DG_75]
MTEAKREIFGPVLGEISQKEIRTADLIAKALLNSGEQRSQVNLRLPDGREIQGVAFRATDGTPVVVTEEFIATGNKVNKLVQYLPRK